MVNKTRLAAILAEAEALQKQYEGKEMPTDVGTKFDALCTEAKAMQDEADREQKIATMQRFAGSVPEPTLPNPKKADEKADAFEVAGYVTLGDYLTGSEQYAKFLAAGAPKEMSFTTAVPHLLKVGNHPTLREGFVPLTREMRHKFSEVERMERKDMPSLGSRVIEPQRLADIVNDVENTQLNLRDVLNVVPTNSNVIEWVGRTAFTRGAAIQSEGTTAASTAIKGEAGTAYTLRSTNVRTLAVWIPASEQQLQDAAQLASLIQTDLIWDVRKLEEYECVWGDGTGLHFSGLDANVSNDNGRDTGSDTLIDKLRRRMTFVRVAGYEPNAMALHPIDWEAVELAKGSDGQYVWAIIRDTLGARIWGARVVETLAMDKGDGNRIAVVGDFIRGASLYDRLQASVAIGWIDDQFVRNLRTLRAEERVAFAVRRPDAFSKVDTA